MAIVLWILTAIAVVVSFVCDRGKTFRALKSAFKRMCKMAGIFLFVLALFAISIVVIPQSFIENMIGAKSGIAGFLLASFAGSVSLMPGFVAFPLSAALRGQGIPYFILAAFTTTLMNVGVVTFALEKQYFGWRVSLVRNAICLAVTVLVTVAISLAFGEVGLWL